MLINIFLINLDYFKSNVFPFNHNFINSFIIGFTHLQMNIILFDIFFILAKFD